MTLFILAKITHILSAIFFIGVVSFRTFIMPILKSKFDKAIYMDIDKLTGMRAKGIDDVAGGFVAAYVFIDEHLTLLPLQTSSPSHDHLQE